jgi:nucleotide-binding universal stress UspA family protein/predicted transcriptional regulator
VPLDGSALAERALAAAQSIAREGATIALIQVVNPDEPPSAADAKLPDGGAANKVASINTYLDQVQRNLGASSVNVRTTIRRGLPAEEILAVTRELDADLIVMATRGRGAAARWWLGSVAEWVVRHAERPVLLVSAQAAAATASRAHMVKDVMTRDLSAVREDEPLVSALRKLLRRRLAGAPVLDATGAVVGVVNERDLLRWQARATATPARWPGLDPAEHAQLLERTPVRTVMSRPVATVDEAATLDAALRQLLDGDLGWLPVTRDGRLAGIISSADILKAMVDQWTSPVDPVPPTA